MKYLSFCKGLIYTEISVGSVLLNKAVAKALDLARESGSPVRKKPEEIYHNSFVNNLEKSGFMKEIWGSENYRR